jgi:hypothetical protein
MALTIRERLETLASPIPLALPSEYIEFVEGLEGRGDYFQHGGHDWWAAAISGLEAQVRTDLWGLTLPTPPHARKLEVLVSYLRGQSRGDSVGCRDGSKFDLERLQNGFWIGENDGDDVFIDQQSLGVFAYIQDDDCVQQWAGSFREFVAVTV